MKKSIITGLFCCLSILNFAQVNRFYYEYESKMDSLKKEIVERDVMALDLFTEGSRFVSVERLKFDSILISKLNANAKNGGGLVDMSATSMPKIGYEIIKKYPDRIAKAYIRINTNLYGLNTPKLQWKILPEKSTIEGYSVQKASTDFEGRTWIAWFTSDIQIPDGPYRFSGLPGLILKIEDTKGDHVFTFKGNRKLTPEEVYDFNNNGGRFALMVTDKQFNKQWNEYKKDPAQNYRANQGISSPMRRDGTPINSLPDIKQREENARKEIESRNNPIELTLYK